MEFYRSEEAGTRPEAVRPLCVGKRRDYLRAGADDGAVSYRAGDCGDNHGRCRIWERRGDGASTGDYYSSRGLRIF